MFTTVQGESDTYHIIDFNQSQVEALFDYCRSLNGDGLHILDTAFKKLGFNLNDVLSKLPDNFCKRQIWIGDYVSLDCIKGRNCFLVKRTRICKGVLEFFVRSTENHRIGYWIPAKCCVKVTK